MSQCMEDRPLSDACVLRVPMRPRDREIEPGAGAEFGLRHGVVGIGDVLDDPPATIEAAVAAATALRGDKAGRMLDRFARVEVGAFVWSRATDGTFHLGRIAGPWRYDDSPAAHAVGIHHVRPTRWLDRPIEDDEAPAEVARTFARGGRNLQRIRDAEAVCGTVALWATHAGA
jgi:hypothetical protein